MKQFLITIVAGSISALVATNGAFAQNTVNTEVLEPQKNSIAVEKVVTPANAHIVDLSAISPKALKAFSKAYKNATGEIWEKNSEGFSARFTANGVSSLIFYNPKGNWQGSVKGYTEDKMPSELRKIVKREYYDYSITYVQEAETTNSEGIPTYIVHMEDKENIKQLRIHDGDMEVWKEFKKQL